MKTGKLNIWNKTIQALLLNESYTCQLLGMCLIENKDEVYSWRYMDKADCRALHLPHRGGMDDPFFYILSTYDRNRFTTNMGIPYRSHYQLLKRIYENYNMESSNTGTDNGG